MWQLLNGKLIKRVGEIVYVVEFKPSLEPNEIPGQWVAYRQECSSVQVELYSSNKIETCIIKCNKDAKNE